MKKSLWIAALFVLPACVADNGDSGSGAGGSRRISTARAGSAAVASISPDMEVGRSPAITGAGGFGSKKLTVDLGSDYGEFFKDLSYVVAKTPVDNAKTFSGIGIEKNGLASDGLGLAPSFKGPGGSAYNADGSRVVDPEIIAGVQKSDVIDKVSGRIVLGDLNDPNTADRNEHLSHSNFGYVALDATSARNPGDTTYWDLLRLATAVSEPDYTACAGDASCINQLKYDGYASAKLHDGSVLEYGQFTWGDENYRITDARIASGKSSASYKFHGRALGGIIQEQNVFVLDFNNNGSYVIAPVSADLSGTATYEFHPLNRGRDKLVLNLGIAGSGSTPLAMVFGADRAVSVTGSLAGFDPFAGGQGEFEAKFYGNPYSYSPSEVVGGFAYKREANDLLTTIVGSYGARK
jgi:hypothetical protein